MNDINSEYDYEGNETGFEKEDKENDIDVPFDPSKIDIIVDRIPIINLEKRLDNMELDLTPEFQRAANIWDNKRKSRLIESILLRIPLPSFYFSEDRLGNYSVVDGLQRLCAIFHFMNFSALNKATRSALNPLRLTGLQYISEIEGLTFHEIDRKFQRRIEELVISVNIIRPNTPNAVKFNVFARLNQGGMPLNAQEIRNAIFTGEWRDHIRELAESEDFLRATEGKITKLRQQDMELVLRYISHYQLGEPFERNANTNLDGFLNKTVEEVLSNWTADEWSDAKYNFYRAINYAYKLLGENAFRKTTFSNSRAPINRGLFEAQLLAITSLTDDEVNFLLKEKNRVNISIQNRIASDMELSKSLTASTGSAKASAIRYFAMSESLKGCLL
ncbi:DUF262 domain-containing protein [Hafnia paralvei]|uniref:DUF262 domain-containing protein n=1 Tax=Hafnia paralvei TaxID=546367 RepID=UPI003CE9EBB8